MVLKIILWCIFFPLAIILGIVVVTLRAAKKFFDLPTKLWATITKTCDNSKE